MAFKQHPGPNLAGTANPDVLLDSCIAEINRFLDNIYTFMIELGEITLEITHINATECRNGKTCTLADVIKLPYDERKYLSWHKIEDEESGLMNYYIHFYMCRQANLGLEYLFKTDNIDWFNAIRESYFSRIRILYDK